MKEERLEVASCMILWKLGSATELVGSLILVLTSFSDCALEPIILRPISMACHLASSAGGSAANNILSMGGKETKQSGMLVSARKNDQNEILSDILSLTELNIGEYAHITRIYWVESTCGTSFQTGTHSARHTHRMCAQLEVTDA